MDIPQPLIDAFWATVQATLVTIVPLVAAWLLGKTVKIAVDAWTAFKAQNADAAYQIELAVEFGMKAAEQNGLIGELAKLGLSKKEFAIDYAQKWLAAQNVKIDPQLLDGLVEAKVQELFPKDAE